MALTCLSCLSHLGAIFGIASFSWVGRAGTLVLDIVAPILMESNISWLMGSVRLLVCSKQYEELVKHEVLTTNGAILNAQKLGLVVTCDRRVGEGVTRKHGKLSGEVSRLHVLLLSYQDCNKLRDLTTLFIFI